MAVMAPVEAPTQEPIRSVCLSCSEPVLLATVSWGEPPRVELARRVLSERGNPLGADLKVARRIVREYEADEGESLMRALGYAPGIAVVVADVYEWQPRAACYVCQAHETMGHKRDNCDRCGGSGYVGEERPPGPMLAVDVAWSDESHVRLLGPRTPRRKGEALYRIHVCSANANSADVYLREARAQGR